MHEEDNRQEKTTFEREKRKLKEGDEDGKLCDKGMFCDWLGVITGGVSVDKSGGGLKISKYELLVPFKDLGWSKRPLCVIGEGVRSERERMPE